MSEIDEGGGVKRKPMPYQERAVPDPKRVMMAPPRPVILAPLLQIGEHAERDGYVPCRRCKGVGELPPGTAGVMMVRGRAGLERRCGLCRGKGWTKVRKATA